MKKLLLFLLVLCFGYTSIAQVKQITPKAWYKNVTEQATFSKIEPQAVYEQGSNQYVNNFRDQDIVIGETYYDLQTNSSMAHRIYSFDDGALGGVWTRSMDTDGFPSCPDRGTGYNYFDGTSWGPYPEARIEDSRTGWPSYAPFGSNGEIVCSHRFSAEGLIFSWRENKGEGDWNTFTYTGPPGNEFIAWPRMVTSGENNEIIHLMSNVPSTVNGGGVYEGLEGALVYSRSTDGGSSWDIDNVILEGMGSDYAYGWTPDDYAWATPMGDVLAFVAFDGITDGVIMKSIDSGDTWERITFYESPDPFFDGNSGDLPQCGGGDGSNALVIDDEGMVHVAFGRQIHLDDTPDDDSWSYFPYSDGLVFWSEGQPALDTSSITMDIIPDDWATHPLYLNGQLAAWTQPNGSDTISAVAPYFASLTSMPTIAYHKDEMGYDIFQIFWSGLSLGFVNPDPEAPDNFRHIWGRYTEGDGMWSEFTDYTGDIFHLFLESAYPSVSQNVVNGQYDILYQSDALPGNALQPTDPHHEAVLNSIVHLPISPLSVDIADEFSINFEVSQNQPNPALTDTYVVVTIEKQGAINFSVSNLLGQVVYRTIDEGHTLGTHSFHVDISSFEPGIYLYTVEVSGKSITKKMLVK